MEALADAAYAALPTSFTRLCEGLVIRVEDFPDEETLDDMQCESEYDLLGLFRGRGLTQGAHLSETGEQPNMIWLYRRPISTIGPIAKTRLERSSPMCSCMRSAIISD